MTTPNPSKKECAPSPTDWAGAATIRNFHCSEHGFITPHPTCPKCKEGKKISYWGRDFDEKFGSLKFRGNPKDAIKSFIREIESAAREAGRESVWRDFQPFLAKYSIDRPIPPSELRQFLGEFGTRTKEPFDKK